MGVYKSSTYIIHQQNNKVCFSIEIALSDRSSNDNVQENKAQCGSKHSHCWGPRSEIETKIPMQVTVDLFYCKLLTELRMVTYIFECSV